MRIALISSLLVTLAAGSALATAPDAAREAKQAHAIISKKCTTCHSKDLIDKAIKAGKDMKAIQRTMEQKGAKLNASERDVLGIYWGQGPLKQPK